jgi:hypothetical protein
MEIKTWIDKTNNLTSSIEEYIVGFQKITGIQLSYDEAIKDIEKLKLEYIENKDVNNIIEDLIFNTTIYNKRCFQSLLFKNEFAPDGLTTLNHLKEFGSFLECDIIYLNTENGEIWMQEPGTYYYDEPDSVVKGFSSGESFLESIYLIQKAFYEKWNKGNPVPNNLLYQLYELNDDDCIEVLNYFFNDLVNFE